jgi:hypothetical protein
LRIAQVMSLLLQTKAQVEAKLGGQGLFTANLLGMVQDGESAFEWPTGDMNSGWKIWIGFFNNKARYVAFSKRSNSVWEQQDTKSSLSMIGHWTNWMSQPEEETFEYVEKNAAGVVVATASGWRGNQRRYAFAYVPDVAGDILIAPVRGTIDQKFPGGGN